MEEQLNQPPDEIVKIKFKTFTKEIFTLEFKRSDMIRHVKAKIKELRNVPIDAQTLVYKGEALTNYSTLESCKIDYGSYVHLVIEEDSSDSETEKKHPESVEITFKDFTTQKTFKLKFALDDDMETVANKVAEIRSDDVYLFLIYNGKLLREFRGNVECLGYTSGEYVLVLGDEKKRQVTIRDFENQRISQRNESNRRYQDNYDLASIEERLEYILFKFSEKIDVKKVPADIVERLRSIHENSVNLIASRYESANVRIKIIDSISSNWKLERDTIYLHSRVEMMSNVITRMDKCTKLAKSNFFSFVFSMIWNEATQISLASLASDCSILHYMIQDAIALISQDRFSHDIASLSKEALHSAKLLTVGLHNEILKAKSPQSISINNIKECIENLLLTIDGIQSIVSQSMNEFFENEMMKQIVIQGRFEVGDSDNKIELGGSSHWEDCHINENELGLSDRFKALRNLANNYYWQSREELTVSTLKQTLLNLQKKFGKSNLDYVHMLLLLGAEYSDDLADNEKAVNMLTEAIDIKIQLLGEEADPEKVSDALDEISSLCKCMDDRERSVEIRVKFFGEHHYIVAEELTKIASDLSKTNRDLEAEQYYKRALAIYESKGDEYSWQCKNIKSKLTNINKETKTADKPT